MNPTVLVPRNCLPWGGTHSLPYLAFSPAYYPNSPFKVQLKTKRKINKISTFTQILKSQEGLL